MVEWLAVRQRHWWCSDAATAVESKSLQSRLELWMIKTGRF